MLYVYTGTNAGRKSPQKTRVEELTEKRKAAAPTVKEENENSDDGDETGAVSDTPVWSDDGDDDINTEDMDPQPTERHQQRQ